MLELEIFLYQLCHTVIDIRQLVVTVHSVGESAGGLSITVYSF